MASPMTLPLELAGLPTGIRIGAWLTVGKLGMGGYGAVYLVRPAGVPRPEVPPLAALKLAQQEEGRGAQRMEREARLLARVKHPNVVGLIETGYWCRRGAPERLPYLVMQFVPGPHLYVWSEERNPRVREALELFRQSALAVHAAHAAGVVHRDIKGENFLFDVGEGRLVLLDFGAGNHEEEATITSTLLPPGTAPYRSPEALLYQRSHRRFFDAPYTFRFSDDQYALGVTWYRVLVDAFPFDEEGPDASYQARLEGRLPPAPAELNPRVPQSVSALILRLLSPRPEDRPSAREVAEELESLLRAGGDALEALLFESYAGPSAPSRTTNDEGPTGPVAPGHEQDPLQRTLRQLDARHQRSVRRRPLQPKPEEPTPSEPAARAERPPAPARRPPSWRAMATIVLGILLVTGLTAVLFTRPHREPAKQPQGEIPSAPTSSSLHPPQEGSPMRTPQAPTDTSPAPEPRQGSAPSTWGSVLPDWLKPLPVVCLLWSGCASTPQPPASAQECPDIALDFMSMRGIKPGRQGYINLDINQQGALSDYGVYREGPIVSVVTEDDLSALKMFPLGTKFHGYMWTGGKMTHVHWKMAELPDGRQEPICIVLGFDERGGYEKTPGPHPGTVIVSKQAVFTVVRRFEPRE